MGKKFALRATKKINIPTLVLSEKKILNETKNHNPPLQVKWSVPNDCRGERNGRGATQFPVESLLNSEFICFQNCLSSWDIPGLLSLLVLSKTLNSRVCAGLHGTPILLLYFKFVFTRLQNQWSPPRQDMSSHDTQMRRIVLSV